MCKRCIETEDHILQCKTYQHRQIRKSWIKEIKELDSNTIPASIRKAITLGISSWLKPTNKLKLANAILTLPDDVRQIYDKQQSIVWEHFIRGRISISWGIAVNKALAGIKDNFTAETWGKQTRCH